MITISSYNKETDHWMTTSYEPDRDDLKGVPAFPKGYTVYSVTASGRSFSFIKMTFVNIPIRSYSKANTWYGDFAVFIIMNMEPR
jgi:hypothetical protein